MGGMILRALVAGCFVLSFKSAATAEGLLAPPEIIGAIEGTWALSPSGEDDPGSFTCAEQPLRIWLTVEDGRYVFHSQHEGAELIERAPVGLISTGAHGTIPALWLRYEGEARTTDAGEPVEWLLYMTDGNTFYWQRRDWGHHHFTAARIRCEDGVPLG